MSKSFVDGLDCRYIGGNNDFGSVFIIADKNPALYNEGGFGSRGYIFFSIFSYIFIFEHNFFFVLIKKFTVC